jgi:sortase A
VARARIATTLRAIAEVALTLAFIGGLFLVYETWWTNEVSQRATDEARQELRDSWNGGNPKGFTGKPENGKPFALMYIPRIKADVWETPVIQGVSSTDLGRGIGHYPKTALPGEAGNFAVAGHRATHGEPFANIDKLSDGDKVYVETRTHWYTYTLKRDKIVSVNSNWTIGTQPFSTSPLPSDYLITLTTCHPRWGSSERWVWWGALDATRTRAEGPPKALANINERIN